MHVLCINDWDEQLACVCVHLILCVQDYQGAAKDCILRLGKGCHWKASQSNEEAASGVGAGEKKLRAAVKRHQASIGFLSALSDSAAMTSLRQFSQETSLHGWKFAMAAQGWCHRLPLPHFAFPLCPLLMWLGGQADLGGADPGGDGACPLPDRHQDQRLRRGAAQRQHRDRLQREPHLPHHHHLLHARGQVPNYPHSSQAPSGEGMFEGCPGSWSRRTSSSSAKRTSCTGKTGPRLRVAQKSDVRLPPLPPSAPWRAGVADGYLESLNASMAKFIEASQLNKSELILWSCLFCLLALP